jgi:riboflavin synthase
MFTGIVEELGTLAANNGDSLQITSSVAVQDAKIGDSIAVNGTCLTVTRLDSNSFTIEVVPETLRRTNLGTLVPGDPVNLERAMAADGRIGGHFVQGHVDGTAEVISMTPEGNSVVARFKVNGEICRYLVDKGFVAVDGVSLTVVEAGDDWFTISLIPQTREVTTLGRRQPGDLVNIEVDILGKYVERLTAASRYR